MNNTYYLIVKYKGELSVKNYTVPMLLGGKYGELSREPYYQCREKLWEEYPLAEMLGFFGREDFARERMQVIINNTQ